MADGNGQQRASELTAETLLSFCRIEPDYATDSDKELVALAHRAALAHIEDTLGLSVDEIDSKPNLAIACMVLVRDMYENRTPYVDKASPNRTVEAIFGLYDGNLL